MKYWIQSFKVFPQYKEVSFCFLFATCFFWVLEYVTGMKEIMFPIILSIVFITVYIVHFVFYIKPIWMEAEKDIILRIKYSYHYNRIINDKEY